MKRIGCLALTAVGILFLATPARAEQGTEEKRFVAGGQVRLNLCAGSYTLKAGSDDRILVAWRTNPDPDDNLRVSIATDLNAKTATIVTHGTHDGLRVVIELPARTDLHLDISAGELRVQGITGNKDLGSWAGNIDVEVGRPADYGRLDLAVRAGDIIASPFGVRKSGLFRSVSQNRSGPYRLRVRLTAGNLTLY